MTCPDTRIQPEPPPPADQFSRVCRDCSHCNGHDEPDKPWRWLCAHPKAAGTPGWCEWAREHPEACGRGAKWFKDALGGR